MAEAMAPVRLELFYGRPQEDPCQWLETFELFLEVNHVEGEQILRFVKYAMREDAYTWFKANQSDILDWEDCKTCLLERFGLDEDTLMYKVDTCNQQSGETVRSFSDRLRKLVGYLPNPLPHRMVSQIFVKGLVPHLRERVQMTFPGNAALPDLIRTAACYEQTFGHSPLGNGYNSHQQPLIEPLARSRNEHANQRNDRDNRQQRPQQQFNRDNQQRTWPRPRDQQPERRNQNQQQLQPVQPGPPREPAAPPRPDLDVLTREMERLRIQIAELQRPGPAANFTQFIEPEHHQPELQQQPAEQATIMYDGFTDPGWPNCWPSLASKRPADTQPEPDLPPPLKRRPNNVESTTVDPNPPVRPAAARPVNPGEPTRPAVPPTPKPVPRRDVPRRPVDLGDLPPLPERNVYRRPLAVATPSVEPIQQIKGLPMKLTVQSYFNHISDEEFDKSMKELRDSRFSFLRSKRDAPPPQGVAAEVIIVQDNSTSPSGSGAAGTSSTHARQNLQRNIISTTVATVPIILRDTVFEEGIIDTGATNTMISQSAARQLGLIDQIEPSRLRYSCADGKTSSPWGILKKLPVGVEGLVFPIDVFVSGATSYDVLLGTDWLTQAHAEISFAKSEMSFRIDPNILGRVPITVVPADKALRYCMFRPPVRLPGDPGGPFAALPPELPEPDLLIEESSLDATSVASASEEDAAEDLSTTGASTVPELEDEPMDPEDAADNAVVQFNASATTILPVDEEPPLPSESPFITEDYMLEKHVFDDIEAVWGPFDVDACCDEGGLNAQIPSYWSPAQDCLLQEWTHKNVYCNPPFSKIQGIVKHCLECYQASPFTTGAVLVLPWWPTAPWFNTVIDNFEIIRQYPPGVQLFTVPGNRPGDPRRAVGPTRWPVVIVKIPFADRGVDPGLQKLVEIPSLQEDLLSPGQIEIPTGSELSAEEREMVDGLIQEFQDVFSPGVAQERTSLMHHRIDTGDSMPIKTRPYRLSRSEDHVIKGEVQKMLDAGVIIPSNSPWSSSPVLVPKPDGSVRFCIDYRPLNAVTKRDNYPMPRIDDTLDSLGQSVQYISKIDCKSAFWLIPVAPEDRPKTAFITKEGLYEFVSMPFGLRNAPATLQRFVNTLLADLLGKFCVIYLDDCLIYSNTFEEHTKHFQQVLERFRAVGFKVNAAKCELLAREVLFLGHIITKAGIKPNPAKVQAVRDALPPSNISEVRSFLGLANYYRRFLPNMASISAPLTMLTRKGISFDWSLDCQEAFESIKGMLTKAPLLRYPDFSREFILYTDWQPGATAAILGQEGEDGEYVIAYASRTLHGAELNYSPTDGELLAIVWAVKLFRPYLYGVHFTIVTDHKALKWLLTTRNLSAKLARYAIDLQEYDFDIVHRAGSLHGNVDGLSRLRQPAYEDMEDMSMPLCCGYTMLMDQENIPPAEELDDASPPTSPSREPMTGIMDLTLDEDMVPHSEVQATLLIDHEREAPNAPLRESRQTLTPLVSPFQAMEMQHPSLVQRYLTRSEIRDVPCQVCMGRDDEETMLLCDKCNQGYHMDCLDPAFERVPRGPWLCPSCEETEEPLPTRDIVDDVDVLDYLAGGRYHPPGRGHRENKRIARRAQNYYFAAEGFPIEWRTREYPLMRKATGAFGPRTVPWFEDRIDIIKELHDEMGHYGVVRTQCLVKERFVWSGMSLDVRLYIQHCPGCQMRNIQLTKPVELTPIAVKGAFHMVGLDLTGPMREPVGRGKVYIASAIDYLTKWVEARIIPNKEAATTAQFFRDEILARHGCPQVVVTDNGQEWEGEFQALMNKCCVEVRKTSPYHPQANGLVERFHGTLKDKLGHAASSHPDSWDKQLSEIMLGYRTSPQASTKFSPFQLLYGRTATLPIENNPRIRQQVDARLHPEEATEPRMEERHQDALDNIARAQTAQKRAYKRRMRPTEKEEKADMELRQLKPGDLVVIKNRKPKKLAPPYIGPFAFVDYHGEDTIIVKNNVGITWKESIYGVGKYRVGHGCSIS
jgi:hypothetical protein